MPNFQLNARCLRVIGALAMLATSAPLLAQNPSASSSDPAQNSGAADASAPVPLAPAKSTWSHFHGQLSAQKYSPLDQINADNVGNLEKVWEIHTGDVSDGSGDVPATVWSATPIFANDTLYIGTPFYRVLALDPATGKQGMALRYPLHAQGADAAGIEEPRRRLLGRRQTD